MIQKWKYVGPHDAVEIYGVGVVKRGKSFESGEDLFNRPDFELVVDDQDDPPEEVELKKLTLPKLREVAEARGIPTEGLKKAALIDALTEKES